MLCSSVSIRGSQSVYYHLLKRSFHRKNREIQKYIFIEKLLCAVVHFARQARQCMAFNVQDQQTQWYEIWEFFQLSLADSLSKSSNQLKKTKNRKLLSFQQNTTEKLLFLYNLRYDGNWDFKENIARNGE
jgi:hypothetical protein